ncbi:MAG: response regulator [Pseudomonadota bacterium]
MSSQVRGRPAEILLAEDNDADARLTRMALDDGKIANTLHHVRDGVEALDYLFRRPPYESAERPDLVLLDLNMPRKDGREVLAAMKADADLHTIPVVVLTTSAAETDVLESYGLNANCYVTKPVDLDAFVKIVQSVQEFWLTIVRLPE